MLRRKGKRNEKVKRPPGKERVVVPMNQDLLGSFETAIE
jgi:hypothetical protein